MKDFIKGLLVLGFFGLLVGSVIGFFYCELHFRYRITVPAGSSTRTYYTDGYSERGHCVRFRQFGQDSTEVCGMYSIIRLSK